MAILRCKEPFSYWADGYPHVIRAGDLVDSADAAVKGREASFEPVEVVAHRTAEPAAAAMLPPVVEQATAAPGERRTRSKTAAKKD